MGGMITDAKPLLDHRRHAFRGPDLAAEAKGWGTTSQQQGKACELLGRQLGLRATSNTPRQSLFAVQPRSLDPLTDSTWSNAEGRRNGALLPALPVEFPRPESATFFPVAGFGGHCLFHATCYRNFRTTLKNSCSDQ